MRTAIRRAALAVAILVPVGLTAPLGSTKGSVIAEAAGGQHAGLTAHPLMIDDGIWYPGIISV